MSDDDGIQAWAPIEVVEGLLKRAEQAEAAIQRVRNLHSHGTDCGFCYAGAHGLPQPEGHTSIVEVCDECDESWPCPTIRALDGPCPTCRGPIRETVGLVCQTCGTDYGRPDGTA